MVEKDQQTWSSIWILSKCNQISHLGEGKPPKRSPCTFKGEKPPNYHHGQGYLGGSIGSQQFAKDFIASQVQEWIRNVEALSEIAQCHPQASLAALTRGLAGKCE